MIFQKSHSRPIKRLVVTTFGCAIGRYVRSEVVTTMVANRNRDVVTTNPEVVTTTTVSQLIHHGDHCDRLQERDEFKPALREIPRNPH